MPSLSPALLAALLLGAGACTGELHELGGPDASGGGGDGGGGGMAVVGFASIQSDLDSLGCAATGGCHGGSAPMTITPMASGAALMADWQSVRMRATAGASSLLLTKPLASSGVSHGGTKPFASTMDATYQRWAAWIAAGAPFTQAGNDGGTPTDDAGTTDGGST